MNILYILVFIFSSLCYISLVYESILLSATTISRLIERKKEQCILDGLGYFAVAYYKEFIRGSVLPTSARTQFGPHNKRIEVEISVRQIDEVVYIEARRKESVGGITVQGSDLQNGLFQITGWYIHS